MEITDRQLLRYDRQIAVKGFDIDKQQQLLVSHALIIGVGGLGCAAVNYLVSAGIGKITLVDPDLVSLSNLPRQTLFSDADLGRAKVEVAKERLNNLNPACEITPLKQHFTNSSEWKNRAQTYNIVIDCSDNLLSRQNINQFCYWTKIPLISGAAIRMEGSIMSFHWLENEPCYQCLSMLFGEEIGSCAENGVIAPLTGVIGSMQAMEAIRCLTHFGPVPKGKFIFYDAQDFSFRAFTVQKNLNCPVCSG